MLLAGDVDEVGDLAVPEARPLTAGETEGSVEVLRPGPGVDEGLFVPVDITMLSRASQIMDAV